MVGPAGFGVTNENNGLSVPTAPDRGVECIDEFRPFPNLPNRPEADLPPGRWWQAAPDYPPEADNPLLDAWLASGDPIAWIGLLGGETIDA